MNENGNVSVDIPVKFSDKKLGVSNSIYIYKHTYLGIHTRKQNFSANKKLTILISTFLTVFSFVLRMR